MHGTINLKCLITVKYIKHTELETESLGR